MTIDELHAEVKALMEAATMTGSQTLYTVCGVLDQVIYFVERHAYRHLNDAPSELHPWSSRDMQVAHALLDELRSTIEVSAAAPFPGRDACPEHGDLCGGESCCCADKHIKRTSTPET